MTARQATSIIRYIAPLVLLAAFSMCGGGCSYIAEMGGRLFTKPPKTTPEYLFGTDKVLVLVDVADRSLEREMPRLNYDLAQAIILELDRTRATGGMVSPRVVAHYRQTTPNYQLMTVPQIGRGLEVDQVLHVVVHSLHLESPLMSDHYDGEIVLGLRVYDVATGNQVWPPHQMEHHLEGRTPTGINADSRSRALDKMLEDMAHKTGLLFAAYEVEKLPVRQEVK